MRSAALGASLGLAVVATPALAEEPRGLDLSWTAPATCPGRADVLSGIVELLGDDRALTAGAPLRALGVVDAGVYGYRLELRFPGPNSEVVRQIESDRCDELDGAAALILALALDPENPRLAGVGLPQSAVAVEAQAEPRKPPSAAPVADPAPRTAETAEARRAPSSGSSSIESVRWVSPSAGARFAVDVGTLPSVALGGSVSASLPFEPMVGIAAISLFAPQTVTVNGAGGTFLLGALSLLPCWPFPLGRVRLLPCASLEADLIAASGRGVDQPEAPFTWFARFGLGAELGYALSQRVALAAGALLLVAPARPRFVVGDGVELFQPSALGGRFSAGLDVAF